jgi:hypothetical protein
MSSSLTTEEQDESALFPVKLVLGLGKLEKWTLGRMQELWAFIGDMECDSTLAFEFVAHSQHTVLGSTTRGSYSYDVTWKDEAFPKEENERFPTLQLGYPRVVYNEYPEEEPRVRLFMTVVRCIERWNAGYCATRQRY